MLTRNLTTCYNLKIFLRNLKGTNKWRDLKDWKLNKTKYFRLRLCVSKCNAPVILLKIAWRPFWDHLMYAESPFELWYLSKKDIIWERKERKRKVWTRQMNEQTEIIISWAPVRAKNIRRDTRINYMIIINYLSSDNLKRTLLLFKDNIKLVLMQALQCTAKRSLSV